MGIQGMVTRKGWDGKTWGANQRISVDEAIAVNTLNGAYASREEAIKGSITAGKLADFVVLADDPHTVDAGEDQGHPDRAHGGRRQGLSPGVIGSLQPSAFRPVAPARALEAHPQLHLIRARRHEVRAAERREEVVERLLVRQVDHAERAPSALPGRYAGGCRCRSRGRTDVAAQSAADWSRRPRSLRPGFEAASRRSSTACSRWPSAARRRAADLAAAEEADRGLLIGGQRRARPPGSRPRRRRDRSRTATRAPPTRRSRLSNTYCRFVVALNF